MKVKMQMNCKLIIQFLFTFLRLKCYEQCVKMEARTGVKWNKRTKNFEPIPGLLTYEMERQKIILESRQKETHNFEGQPLRLTYFENPGFFEFHDNGTRVSGLLGDMWTILSKLYNFTIIGNEINDLFLGAAYDNGSYSGTIQDLLLNKTDVVPKFAAFHWRIRAADFSPVLWINRQWIFAHRNWKRDRAWMFNVIQLNVWVVIFAFILTLSLASVVTQRILLRHRGQKIEQQSFFNHFFYSFAATCNQFSDGTGGGSRLLSLTIAIFSYLVLTTYNSILIYSMTAESFEAPFHDLESLFENTNFRIVVLKDEIAHTTIRTELDPPIFPRIKNSQRFTVVTNADDLYDKVCNHPDKYVMLSGIAEFSARGPPECSVVPVGPSYHQTTLVSGISRGVLARKSLNIGILRLQEYGVLGILKKRYMPSLTTEGRTRYADSITIDMECVSLIFGVLFVGIVLSIIICVAENIVCILKKRKTFQQLAKRQFFIK